MARRVQRNSWRKIPLSSTSMLEAKELPKGGMWESCAIMQYLCNKHEMTKFYPKSAEQRATIDSAMFYIIGTLYPLVARSTYPALGGLCFIRVKRARAMPIRPRRRRRRSPPSPRSRSRSRCSTSFHMDGKPFIGGATPSIADMRLTAATLEFLSLIDHPLPVWAKTYIADMETSLGKAALNPQTHVWGYIAYVKSQKKKVRELAPVSSAGEFHPRALAETDVRLSPHPAPIVRPRPCRRRQ